MCRCIVAAGLLSIFLCSAPTARAEQQVREVTEELILAHADRHAPSIQVALHQLELGRAEIQAASPLLPEDPELSLSVGPRLSSGSTTLDLEVAVSQPLEVAGERGLRLEAARRTHRRFKSSLQNVRWRAHVRVHHAFHAALVAKERVQVSSRLLGFARNMLSIAQRRQAAGAISGLEAMLVEGEVAGARQALLAAQGAHRARCWTLAELAGWSESLPDPVGSLERPRLVRDVRAFRRRALTGHPKLRLLSAAVQEAEAQGALASRRRMPRPSLGVSYSRETESDGVDNTIVLGTLSFRIPLWQRNRQAVARTAADVRLARARYRTTRAAIGARIARAIASVNTAAEKVRVLGSDVLPTLSRSLTMLRRSFEEGKIDVLQVMVARGRVLESQRQTLDAYDDYFTARAELALVLGAEPWSTPDAERMP